MRIALLISGGGTTAEAIIRACGSGLLPNVTPVCVIASRAGIPGIARVLALGIPKESVHVISPKDFKTPDEFGNALLAALHEFKADFVGQYGWLPRTPANVVAAYESMMVNQHPGPLDYPRPDFGGAGMYGRRVHCARLLFVRGVDRDLWTETTVHRVTPGLDQGAVVGRKQVVIEPSDDVETLKERMLPVEHEVQIGAVHDFANNTVNEFGRETPLVGPGEEQILAEAKRAAILLYPKG